MLEEGKTVSQVARDLDLTASALGGWVQQARADRSKGKTGLTTAEREELGQLRKENRLLRMERDFAKKAAAFVCHERSPVTGREPTVSEMRDGPSEPGIRARLQTNSSCVGKESTW